MPSFDEAWRTSPFKGLKHQSLTKGIKGKKGECMDIWSDGAMGMVRAASTGSDTNGSHIAEVFIA